MSTLTPDVAETLALRDQVPPGPVVMVNLLERTIWMASTPLS